MDGIIYASAEEEQAALEKQEQAKEDERKREMVSQARKRFAAAEEAESEIRKLADEDIRFRAGDQWDQEILNMRKVDKRPALVINRIPQFERQITNEQRQSRPSIQVSPVDSNADVETAEVLQGLIRHIEYDSAADVAYDTALTSAVRGGLGYIRLVTEYESEESFEQALKIKRVRDPFSVYFDPGHQEQDGSDADWAFVVDDGISKEAFKAEYPDCKPVEGGWGDRQNTKGHSCQVVEYFYRERVADELLMLQQMGIDPETGQPIPVGEPAAVLKSALEAETQQPEGLVVLNARPTHRIKVCWAKIAGDTVIDEREFPSKWIPIVPVLGDELWVGGKRILEGMVRHAKDPQRMYNFWSSAITESIALAPKAPFIGAEGQFEGYEKDWAAAASQNKAFLQYRPKSVGGAMLPPPQRNTFEAPIAAMTQAMMFASDDMKSTTGIYDAALGNRSNESTGIAIRERRNQSQVGTMHFSDNLTRALRHLGRIAIAAIRIVYSGERVVRILGEDMTEKLVGINGAQHESQDRLFDMNVGRYDVSVSQGPSFTSKRQEAVGAAMELTRANPKIGEVIADLMVSNMDWPGAKKMAERLKKLLQKMHPELVEPDEKNKMDPAQLAMQVQQSQQMIEQLTKAVHEAHDSIEAKTADNASRERIEMTKLHVTLVTKLAELESREATAHGVALIRAETAAVSRRLALTGFDQPIDLPTDTGDGQQPQQQMPQQPPQGAPL